MCTVIVVDWNERIGGYAIAINKDILTNVIPAYFKQKLQGRAALQTSVWNIDYHLLLLLLN